MLEKHHLRCVVETGARFCSIHAASISRRSSVQARGPPSALDFLCRSCDIAADLGADAVSFWSGTADDAAGAEEWSGRLLDGCRRLCDHAQARGVRLAFEPEPGMFIDRLAKFAALREDVNCPHFGLTLDVGHLQCQGELPIEDHIYQWRKWLWNVHIEDMRRGVHDHLMFGEGDIDFPPLLACLQEIGYTGGVHVELSRHSHDAVETARRAMAFLDRLGIAHIAKPQNTNVSWPTSNSKTSAKSTITAFALSPKSISKSMTASFWFSSDHRAAARRRPCGSSPDWNNRHRLHPHRRPVHADVPRWQRNLAMVFQKPALVPSKTVRRNLNFGNELRRGFLDWFSLPFRRQRRGRKTTPSKASRGMLDLLDVLDRKPASCPAVSCSASPWAGRCCVSRRPGCWTSRWASSTGRCDGNCVGNCTCFTGNFPRQ